MSAATTTEPRDGVAPARAADAVRPVEGGVMVADDARWVAVHSLRNPQREAEALVATALEGRADARVLVAIGLGLGYVLDVLDARGWGGRVLALEPEPALVPHLHARRDLRAWLDQDRLRVLTGPDYEGSGECWRWFDGSGDEPPLIVNPVLARIRAAQTAAARGIVERLRFNAKANADARRTFGGRYVLNTLKNLRALAEEGDVAALAGATRGLPAIVVAAGPSLDAHLDALRAAEGRALVIAVDTALRPLLAAGIQPHLVVAVDPGEANVRHLWELPPCGETHLVAEASLDSAALASFRGRTFLFSVADHQPWPWLSRHGAGRGRLRAWGSVLTTAFDLALHMGCDPIAFAGADLAFTGNRPYARGIVSEEHWRRLAAWGVPIETQWQQHLDTWPPTEEPDVLGEPVRTAPHLVAFRNWLVEQAARETSRRIVNVTGAGILHGRRVQQDSLPAFVSALPSRGRQLVRALAARHRPAEGVTLLQAAAALRESSAELDAWEQFADGLTRPGLLAAVRSALHDAPPPLVPAPDPSKRAQGCFDAEWIAPLAASLPLVPMIVPRERMQPGDDGLSRTFRFRTTTARLMACALRLPDGAVAEDGVPLTCAPWLDSVGPAQYFVWRDEVYIRASDGTDPRDNGRTYTILLPEAVAYAERLPLAAVLAHNL